jgi:hypothetical protein
MYSKKKHFIISITWLVNTIYNNAVKIVILYYVLTLVSLRGFAFFANLIF